MRCVHSAVVRVLSWRSSASMPVFFCGNVLFLGAASWSATGLLSFLAKVLVVQIAWGFTQRHVFGRPAPPMTLTADDIAEYARRLEASANGALRLYERVCLAADLRIAVLTVMSVYAFTLASSFVSVGTMAYTGFLAAFGAAPAYGLVQTHVEQVRARASPSAWECLPPVARRRRRGAHALDLTLACRPMPRYITPAHTHLAIGPVGAQACAMAARECERVIAALTFKHVLGMTAGAFFAWLGAGLWTKFVVMLTVPMVLKLYRDANRDEVSESLERMGKHVPRRLSLGANVVGRMAVEGARMAMDSGLDFFSPAKGAKHKYM